MKNDICAINLNAEIKIPNPKTVAIKIVFSWIKNSTIKLYIHDLEAQKQFANFIINKRILFDDVFSKISIEDDEFFDLDFSNSFVSIPTNSVFSCDEFWVFELTSFSFKYKKIITESEHKKRFYLTDNSSLLIPTTSTVFDSKGEWKSKDLNRKLRIGEIEFKFGIYYYEKSDSARELTIRSENYFEIYNNDTMDKILSYANTICLLSSIFIATGIEFYMAVLEEPEFDFIILKQTNYLNKPNAITEYFINIPNYRIYDFFNNIIEPKEILEHQEWWHKNINKLLLSRNLEGESQFLVLYNIIEQSFLYLNNVDKISEVKSDFLFKGLSENKKQIKEKCRELINEIKKYIPVEEKEEIKKFENQNDKISFCKTIVTNNSNLVTSNKIQLLMNKLNIDSKDIGLNDVKEIVSFRDDLIHANRIIHEDELFKMYKIIYRFTILTLIRLLNKDFQLSETFKAN